MNKEIINANMLGISLLTLALVILLGYGIWGIAQDASNNIITDTQGNMATITTDATLQEYDQKVMTGTQVLEACHTLKGRPIAILIHNVSMTKGLKTYPTDDNKPETIDPPPYAVKFDEKQYLNYNALLASNAAGATPKQLSTTGVVVAGGSTGILTIKDGIVYSEFGFSTGQAGEDKGKVLINNCSQGLNKVGTCEFLPLGAYYETALLKDISEQIIGIVFTQVIKE